MNGHVGTSNGAAVDGGDTKQVDPYASYNGNSGAAGVPVAAYAT